MLTVSRDPEKKVHQVVECSLFVYRVFSLESAEHEIL